MRLIDADALNCKWIPMSEQYKNKQSNCNKLPLPEPYKPNNFSQHMNPPED